ncbi:MAG TPA: hypothetical protein H9934_07505, partial [Candidatus Anaerobutyricum faecale]|nr:hypothetical protein [Candidatus Anaerobutyricum faecale]
AEALTRKQVIQAVWNKFKAIIGNKDISGIGDGTVTGALVGLNGNINNKVKMINAKIKTDSYGQCNLKYLVGGSAVLCVQIDGGYGAFCMTGTNIRVFRVSQLPFTFASEVELNAYIFYCPSFTVG